MTDDPDAPHHHTLRERIDAARAAAEEAVAEESGQIGSEVSALALPFEEVAAAVRAAIDPDSLAAGEHSDAPEPARAEPREPEGSPEQGTAPE